MYFNKLFWGYLFFFDFRIQGFDILPNIIGYWIIYLALNRLASLDEHFKKAKKYSIPLILLSVANIYQVQDQITQFKVSTIGIALIIVSIISSILYLLMTFHICMGISEVAKRKSNNDLEEIAIKRWKHYLAVQILTMVFVGSAYFTHTLIAIIFIPLFILSIIVLFLIMDLMKLSEEAFLEELSSSYDVISIDEQKLSKV